MGTVRAKDRVMELDFLRGVAVFMILATHYPVLPVFSGFFVALDFFFVLSGFLVAGLLIGEYQRNGRADIFRFLIRRGLKIYPSFYTYLAITIGLLMIFPGLGAALESMGLNPLQLGLRQVLSEVFYLQNYIAGIWPHNWSLALEEQFYLLLAAIFLILNRRAGGVRMLAVVSIAVLAVALLLRYHYVMISGGLELYPLKMAHLRIDGIFAGVLCRCIYHLRPAKIQAVRPAWWLGILLAGLVTSIGAAQLLLHSPGTHIWGYDILYAGSCMVVVSLYLLGLSGNDSWTRYFRVNRLTKGVAYIGRHSYNIYLWHVVVLCTVFAVVQKQAGINIWNPLSWKYLVLYGVLSIITGIVVSRLLEMPILFWRDRRFP